MFGCWRKNLKKKEKDVYTYINNDFETQSMQWKRRYNKRSWGKEICSQGSLKNRSNPHQPKDKKTNLAQTKNEKDGMLINNP